MLNNQNEMLHFTLILFILSIIYFMRNIITKYFDLDNYFI